MLQKELAYTLVFFLNLLIPIAFQPDGLNLVYFNINGLRHIKDILNENKSFWHKLIFFELEMKNHKSFLL